MDFNESLPEDDDLTVLEYVRGWIDAQFKIKDKSAEALSEQVQILESSAGVKPAFWIGISLTLIGQILLVGQAVLTHRWIDGDLKRIDLLVAWHSKRSTQG